MGKGFFSEKMSYMLGWWPLFEILKDDEGEYLPLDNRVLFLAYLCMRDKNPDMAGDNGRGYAKQAIDAMGKRDDKAKELRRDEAMAIGGEIYDYRAISVTTIPGAAGERSGRKMCDYGGDD